MLKRKLTQTWSRYIFVDTHKEGFWSFFKPSLLHKYSLLNGTPAAALLRVKKNSFIILKHLLCALVYLTPNFSASMNGLFNPHLSPLITTKTIRSGALKPPHTFCPLVEDKSLVDTKINCVEPLRTSCWKDRSASSSGRPRRSRGLWRGSSRRRPSRKRGNGAGRPARPQTRSWRTAVAAKVNSSNVSRAVCLNKWTPDRKNETERPKQLWPIISKTSGSVFTHGRISVFQTLCKGAQPKNTATKRVSQETGGEGLLPFWRRF